MAKCTLESNKLMKEKVNRIRIIVYVFRISILNRKFRLVRYVFVSVASIVPGASLSGCLERLLFPRPLQHDKKSCEIRLHLVPQRARRACPPEHLANWLKERSNFIKFRCNVACSAYILLTYRGISRAFKLLMDRPLILL